MAEQIRPRGLPGPELCEHPAGEVCDMCDPKGRREQKALRKSSGLDRAADRKANPRARPGAQRWHGPRGVQQMCFARSGHRCERDGKRAQLHAHHRKLRSQGGRDVLSNLAALCAECHMWCHEHPLEAQLGGYIVPSWADPAARGMFLHDGRLVLLDDEPVLTEDGWAGAYGLEVFGGSDPGER